jgi:ABC-2 type transport system ATP-binding protein
MRPGWAETSVPAGRREGQYGGFGDRARRPSSQVPGATWPGSPRHPVRGPALQLRHPPAVDGVDLLISAGETFGLLGPNGAGKTTTIRMLTTLLKPDQGTVAVFGVDAVAQPMLVRRLIGYVPQLLSADASLTGRENVELFARLFDVPRRVRGQRVDEALSAMGLTEAGQRLVKPTPAA